MKHQVQLPADLLIDYWRFCKAIAQAICPAGEQGLEGIDCIVGMQRTYPVTMPVPVCAEEKRPVTADWHSVPQSDDDLTLDHLCADQPHTAASSQPLVPPGGELKHQVVELTLPYQLTDDDRRLMESLLVDLPALRYPLSEDDAANFMSAYFKLPNRPVWEPRLITAATIEQRREEQEMVMRHHQKALQDELTLGRLVAVDANHVPVTKLAVGAFIPRDQAIAYLDRYGISHCDKGMGDCRDAQTQVPAISQEPRDEKRSVGRERTLSDKECRAVVNLRNELKREGAKDYTQQAADKYGISPSYVRRLVRKAKAEQDAGSIDKLLAKKRK